MGTNVCSFANHNLPTDSGSALLQEFEKRFRQKAVITGSKEDKDLLKNGKGWRVSLSEGDGNADKQWELTNEMWFHYHSPEYFENCEVCFYGPLVELENNHWSDWSHFVNVYIDWENLDLDDPLYKKYRREIYRLMKLTGSTRVLYASDKQTETLLFTLDEQLYTRSANDFYTHFPTLEQVITIAQENEMPVLHYPMTEEQWIRMNKQWKDRAVLIDDFKDEVELISLV